MDSSIGKVVSSLTKEQRDNTLIIYVGDNGTPGPVADKKAMTISGSGVTRAGQREEAMVNTVDLYATIAEAAGVGTVENIDGRSLYRLLSDANAETAGLREIKTTN